jgi:hypothetical protein
LQKTNINEVWVVSHAGHAWVSLKSKDRTKGPKFNLRQQVRHKVCFVKDLLEKNPNQNICFAGHSVGGWIALQMIEEVFSSSIPYDNLIQVFLLCPTVMHIGATPRGIQLGPMIHYAGRPCAMFAGFMSLLPKRLQRWILKFNVGELPHILEPTRQHFFRYYVVRNALYMASHELKEINQLDQKLIESHLSKLAFYYTIDDGWAPPTHYHHLTRLFPTGQFYLDGHTASEGHSSLTQKLREQINPFKLASSIARRNLPVSHAFVMDFHESDIVADYVRYILAGVNVKG